MPAEETSSTLQIGEWTVHPALDCITRGTETQKLEPRAMRLLLCLADSAGAVVSVDRLLAEVWPDVVVGSASVYQAVSQLRKVLGDADPSPTYIATVPRKGYRLIASVERATAPAHAPEAPVMPTGTATSRRVWVVAGVVAALASAAAYFLGDKAWLSQHTTGRGETPVATGDKSIAVLPFVDMSEKKDQEYFSDGLAEELIEQLGKTPGLKVIARTSSFSFKGKSDDIPTIALKLKVANVLEGSVRRSGNHLRVSTQLIRADSGQPLWSETFDREFKDVFTIQDEIGAAVVTALKVQLNGGSTAARGHGTTNPEAYNAYLLGRQLHLQGTVPSWHQAIEAYERAIGLDPHYADAYADLAVSEYYLADQTGDHALGKLAEQSAQRAIDLDPSLATGYSVRAFLRYLYRYDWVGAESDLKQALALEPTNSRVLSRYGNLLSYLGRTEEATAMLRKAIEQDPLQNTNWYELGIALSESGDHPGAYDAFHHALAIRPTDNFSKFHLARLQLVEGKAQEALATFQSNSDEEFRDAGVAMAEYTLSDAKASQQALDRLIATGAGDAAYQIAEVYAWRGEKDKAFEWLERAYRQQDGGLADLKADLQLASLHSDPRYLAMLRKLNFPPH
jgi:TolB-like protein/DNA-binding winged helix-turn-helix (wHTH) protein/thioredoxin-like negative regulator of GroEL